MVKVENSLKKSSHRMFKIANLFCIRYNLSNFTKTPLAPLYNQMLSLILIYNLFKFNFFGIESAYFRTFLVTAVLLNG